MPPIRQLSQSLINKIAAGEVIERPASVVKELMENAVDAGADRIDVAIEAGGAELIRVVDNGSGIPPDELALAVASHATSKLADADDLFSVGTLGFRGEALASIAEISRTVLRSRTPDALGGAEFAVHGGQPSAIVPCGCPVGTSVEVRNLFFNTPVRRKFLRSTQTELGHAGEAFVRIALAYPHIHFTLRHNDRPVFELSGAQDWLTRIATVLGRELAEGLLWIESADGAVRLSGYVGHPSHSRSNNRMQYIFLNGRNIRDRALQHALGEAYRGLLLTGRYPVAVLRLEMPPDMVDVNVHPTKLEVRFQDSGPLYGQLLATLRTKFLGTDLTPRVPASSGEPQAAAHDADREERVRRDLVDWVKGRMGDRADDGVSSPSGTPGTSLGTSLGTSYGADRASSSGAGRLEMTRLDPGWIPPGRELPWHREDAAVSPIDDPTAPRNNPVSPSDWQRRTPPADPSGSRAMQVHNRYLVAESDDGVMVIDQHALHERILYEQLRARVLAGSLESQALLVPEPVDLPPAEAAVVLDNRELLAQLGIRIEPFGGGTVLVASYPAMLATMSPRDVLRDVIEQLLAEGKSPDRRDLVDHLLHRIACKAAIKAGDRLSDAEIAALLSQRHMVDDAHHCPHGRPTALIFTREELDKQFKRI